jgi:hypothetical protein
MPACSELQQGRNSQQLCSCNPQGEAPEKLQETELLGESTKTLLLGCFFSAFSQQRNPHLSRSCFLRTSCSYVFPRTYMLLMCSLGSDKVGEICGEGIRTFLKAPVEQYPQVCLTLQ